ncbi:MAG: DUF4332 domain-containing protein [Pirellula sp.]|nr:DUF4332 domain-containing protein [Pirellula sp.]
MHLIRLDIDRKNSTAHLQAGPFGGGLNAIYAPMHGGGATMSRFVRSILFRGNYVNEVFETEEGESIDGSLQWVDATGHVRMMSFAGGSAMLPGGFVNSPLHPSQNPLHEHDAERIRGLGNIFWEGDDGDARWDELRGDILGMIFCSPLGSLSPEKLWWSASRLGVHSPARQELDEGYQRLKAEEHDLLDRLRNADAVDHDRAWWALERDRLLAEIGHVSQVNATPSHAYDSANQTVVKGLRERMTKIQVELANLRNALQDNIVAEANSKAASSYPSVSTDVDAFHNGQLNHVSLGRHRLDRNTNTDYASESLRLKSRIERLVAEQADIEIQLRNTPVTHAVETRNGWDDAQLRQQLAHADEMLRRWDRRTQWHRRLAEVQSHLRTRSPYRRTSDGSLIPIAEKYLRELTAGAARQLPPWAVESSYLRGHDMPVDFDGHTVDYGYRDTYYDRRLPANDSRQRKLVDLAIRLAIAEAAVPRIGRIPFLFDNSVEGLRGESLEQVLHVLAGFARDGRQILLATSDEFIARRISAHGGTVSRMHEILRYARPRFVMDSSNYLGIHPHLQSHVPIEVEEDFSKLYSNRPAAYESNPMISTDLVDINKQLAALANEQEEHSWWNADHSNYQNRPVRTAPVGVWNAKYGLHLDSPVADIPTVDASLAARFQHAGIHRVGDLLRTTAESAASSMRVNAGLVYYLQCVAELMTSVPKLGAFDARVLVGCGITRSRMLRDLDPEKLVDRVEEFLRSQNGGELARTATRLERDRINAWLGAMRQRSRVNRNAGYNFVNEGTRAQDESRDVAGYEPSREYRVVGSQFESNSNRDFAPHKENASLNPSKAQRAVESIRMPSAATPREPRNSRTVGDSRTSENAGGSKWKFYLELESPVVDAPSIGPKMAEKLAAISIDTISDLVSASPDQIANQLQIKYVSAETVAEWQKQALMVCRIPNLRGHDAQILVGVGLSTPEELASADVSALMGKVVKFASGKAGQRVLRGASAPDKAEVVEWIHWAQNCRAIRAA